MELTKEDDDNNDEMRWKSKEINFKFRKFNSCFFWLVKKNMKEKNCKFLFFLVVVVSVVVLVVVFGREKGYGKIWWTTTTDGNWERREEKRI